MTPLDSTPDHSVCAWEGGGGGMEGTVNWLSGNLNSANFHMIKCSGNNVEHAVYSI